MMAILILWMYVRTAAPAVEETVPPAKPCVPEGTIGNDAPTPSREASPEDSPKIGTSSVDAAANRRTARKLAPAPAREASPEDSPEIGTSSVEAAANRRTVPISGTSSGEAAARRRTAGRNPAPKTGTNPANRRPLSINAVRGLSRGSSLVGKPFLIF